MQNCTRTRTNTKFQSKMKFEKIIYSAPVLTIIVIFQLTLVSSRVENFMSCQPQGNIKVISKYNQRFNIYGVKINANFNDNEEIFAKNDPDYYYFNINKPGIDYNSTKQPLKVDFSINHVRFTGFVRPESEVVEEKKYAEFITYVSAAAQYRKNTDLLIMNGVPTNLNYNKRRCSVGFLRQSNPLQEKYFADDEIEKVVLDLIESCIVSHVCDNIDRNDDLSKYGDYYKIQDSINEIADKVAPSLIQSLIQPNTRLPDISGSYTKIITANFQGINVSIINTPDIERASNIKLSQNGYKYTIGGDFRFHRLNFHIEDFKIKAPITTSSGVTDLYLSRLTVAIKVEMDYTDSQCKMSLKDLDIYDYGTITINRPNSKENTWIPFLPSFSMKNESSTLVESVIIAKAHNITTKILNDKLINIDCNDFSYFIPSPDVIKLFWDTMIKTVQS